MKIRTEYTCPLELVHDMIKGKWVNDKGIPEVKKLIQISNLFGVSMDYLLKEDCEEKNVSEEKAVSNSGYYVSQEMLDGYIWHCQLQWLQF